MIDVLRSFQCLSDVNSGGTVFIVCNYLTPRERITNMEKGMIARTPWLEVPYCAVKEIRKIQTGTKVGQDHLGSDRITSLGRINSDRLKVMIITKTFYPYCRLNVFSTNCHNQEKSRNVPPWLGATFTRHFVSLVQVPLGSLRYRCHWSRDHIMDPGEEGKI